MEGVPRALKVTEVASSDTDDDVHDVTERNRRRKGGIRTHPDT